MSPFSSDLESACRIAALGLPAVRRLFRSSLPRESKDLLYHIAVSRRLSYDHGFKVKTYYGDWFSGNTKDVIGSMIYYFGIWEPAISEYVTRTLRPGDTFVDVGANQGWYTILASRLTGPTGRVVAIEACSPIFLSLQRNISLNRCENVMAIHSAAWNTQESLELYQGPKDNMGSTSVCREHINRKAIASEFITAKPLSELVPAELWPSIRLLKIDVEGAEWEVVEGMSRMLESLPEDVEFITEITPRTLYRRGRLPEELLAPFRRLGFNVYRVRNDYEVDLYLDFNTRGNAERPQRYDAPVAELSDLVLTRRDCSFL